MQNLTKASQELFRRQPDECFESLTALSEHCQRQKEACVDRWVPPRSMQTNPVDVGRLMLAAGDDGAFEMNAWSFGQLCRLAGVATDTINRLSPDTASRAFAETLPSPVNCELLKIWLSNTGQKHRRTGRVPVWFPYPNVDISDF